MTASRQFAGNYCDTPSSVQSCPSSAASNRLQACHAMFDAIIPVAESDSAEKFTFNVIWLLFPLDERHVLLHEPCFVHLSRKG